MLRRLARSARIRTNRRILDRNFIVAVSEHKIVEVFARYQLNTDAIGLADWRKRPFPNRPPAQIKYQSKGREDELHALVLVPNAQIGHGQSP